MEITLKDGNKIAIEGAASAIEVAKQISESLAKAAIV